MIGIYNIYIYSCILSILSLYVINMSTQIQLWVEEFVSNRFKPHSAVVPGRFWYIFLTAQFAEQVQEMRIPSQEDQHTHTDIYIYVYTPWEPLKPSFLGLSAHISRAENVRFSWVLGSKGIYTERPGVFVGCFTLQATKSKIPAKTRIIKQFQIVELVFMYVLLSTFWVGELQVLAISTRTWIWLKQREHVMRLNKYKESYQLELTRKYNHTNFAAMVNSQ